MTFALSMKNARAGLSTLALSAALLLAACGPEGATPTSSTQIATQPPRSGGTATAGEAVTAEGTISTDSPTTRNPLATNTATSNMTPMPGSTGTAGTDMPAATPGTPGSTNSQNEDVEGDSVEVSMGPLNDSNQSGTTTITDMGNGMVKVVVDIAGIGTADPQPAHIHKGTCASPDPNPEYPLSNVVNGKSVIDIQADFADLTASPHIVNIHKSAAEAKIYTSCGDIVEDGS